jgi:hypothetical protein
MKRTKAKKAELPILEAHLSTSSAMRTLTAHGARGAVIKTGPEYRLVLLDDIGRMFSPKRSIPLDSIRHFKVDNVDPGDVKGGIRWANVTFDRAYAIAFEAPLYVCPRGDHSSTEPAICPVHDEPMVEQKG